MPGVKVSIGQAPGILFVQQLIRKRVEKIGYMSKILLQLLLCVMGGLLIRIIFEGLVLNVGVENL